MLNLLADDGESVVTFQQQILGQASCVSNAQMTGAIFISEDAVNGAIGHYVLLEG